MEKHKKNTFLSKHCKPIFEKNPPLKNWILELRFLGMDEGILRLTSRDLEKSEGEEQKKSSSLDLSLATLHQAENKVYTTVKGVNIF